MTTSSQNSPKNQQRDWIQLVSLSLAAIFFVMGLIVLCYIIWTLSYQFQFQDNIDLEASSRFGDYVGGVIGTLWSLTGVLLFFSSLWTQRREFALQREEFALQRKELELQRVELWNQRKEYATTRIMEVIYRQLELLSKKAEALYLPLPTQGQRQGIGGQQVIDKFPKQVIDRLKRQQVSLLNDSQTTFIRQMHEEFATSRTAKEHLRCLNQTIDICIKLIEQREHNREPEYEEPLLDEDTRTVLYLILDGNLAIEQHHLYLSMMKRIFDYGSQVRQHEDPDMQNRYLLSEQNQIELIDDLIMKLDSIMNQIKD